MSAMGILLFALSAGWLGLRGHRPGMLAAAAILCALCVSTNFYGATALAIFFALMVWTSWVAHGGAGVRRRDFARLLVASGGRNARRGLDGEGKSPRVRFGVQS
jgi:hypothetical protein